MSQPPLESTPIGKKISDKKVSPLKLTLVRAKTSDPITLTLPTESSKRKERLKKSMYQRIWIRTQVCQTHHQANMICLMTANTANQKANDAIKRKRIEITRNRTCQTRF